MTNTKKNPIGEVPETIAKKRQEDNPKSMRLTPETIKRMGDVKYLIGARTWEDLIIFLLDDSPTVQQLAAGFTDHSEEAREMGMLLSKVLELFKLSWTLSNDTEARVTQEQKAIIAKKDNIIAALQMQHKEDVSTRTEMQEHIEKLETEINTMGRELEAARMRADTLAQVDRLTELIESMQAAAKTATESDNTASDSKEGAPPEDVEEEELSPEGEDTLDQYDSGDEDPEHAGPF